MYTAAIDRNMMADAEVMNPARAAETTAPVIRIENLKKSFGEGGFHHEKCKVITERCDAG